MSRPDYDVAALERGIEQCRANIKTFEDAIEKERQTMADYRIMIDHIKERSGDDQE